MSAKKTDISQIRKYLAGELDARAMHQLEREAQDDPFLMDAIEGYSQQSNNQQALDELQQKIQQRVTKGKVYQLPYRVMAVAASVLIILSAAYLLWPAKQQAPVKQIATIIPKTAIPQTGANTQLKPTGKQQLAANTVVPPPSPQPELSQAAAASAAGDINTMAATVTPTVNADTRRADTAAHTAATYQPKPNDSLSAGMALAVSKQPAMPGPNNNNPAPAKMMRAAVMAKVTTKISGIVSDETGHPLAGASITEKGKNDGVKTDSKGKFSIPGQDGELLSVTSPGYDGKEIKGDIHDSLNVILQPADKSVSEMVAIGFGQALTAQKIKAAHPQIGWDNYNGYLKGKAIIADGKAGTVRLSFTVDSKGQLDNFKITKTLSPAADQLAISMVKDGPPWAPAINGATKTISLKIEFKLQRP